MSHRLPRNFLITKPRPGSVVVVHGKAAHPFKAVVVPHPPEASEDIVVHALSDRTQWTVSFRQCTHGAA